MRRAFPYLTLCILFSACSSPNTPEEVVRQFSQNLSTGNCESLMDIVTEDAKEIVQGSIDAGCLPYDSKVDSVICVTKGDHAKCDCHETRKSINFKFSYDLTNIEGEWKVAPMQKGDMEEETEAKINEEDYIGMIDYTLEEYGLPITIKLPDPSDMEGRNFAKVTRDSLSWLVQIGKHFNLTIEDHHQEEDILLKELDRLTVYDSLFEMKYETGPSNFIRYSKSLKAIPEAKSSYHCYAVCRINEKNYVFKCEESGSLKPIIDDMILSIKSAKSTI